MLNILFVIFIIVIVIFICYIWFNRLYIINNDKIETFSNINDKTDNTNDDIKTKIDKIYVINLDKNTDRWEYVYKQSINANIPITKFNAVYGKELSPDDKRLKTYFTNNNKLISGQIGCALSHIEIWEDVIKNNYNNVLIFEDDVVIPSNFWELLKPFYNSLPNNWNMLLLGGTNLYGKKYNEHLLKPFNKPGNWGLFSYLITNNTCKIILNNIKNNKLSTPIDNYLINNYYYNTNYEIFFVNKYIIKVDDETYKSDIIKNNNRNFNITIID
jgi:GR25 family glycosyltransferase involved in LPS biosynthesis